MKNKIIAATMALGLLVSASVFADNIGPGLGRVLLKGQKGKLMELVGFTLNGIAGNGLFVRSKSAFQNQNMPMRVKPGKFAEGLVADNSGS